jgi:3-deoxy-D-arabino-heptulosonate 7-phosphate (DAHP) synthase
MHDIGRKLLMTVGMENPDDASIALAVEANDAFIQAHRFAAHNPS